MYANASLRFNSFWNYFTPLGGAWLADTYLGRFRTIWIGVIVAIVGHVILIVSAVPSVMAEPHSAVGAVCSLEILVQRHKTDKECTSSPLV